MGKCVSCTESNDVIITAHCVECNAPLCAGHIFECRACDRPMCNSCWNRLGKDFCKADSDATKPITPTNPRLVVAGLVNPAVTAIMSGDGYWDRTDRVQQSGRTPQHCGEPMTAEDDHGRFLCFKCGHRTSM